MAAVNWCILLLVIVGVGMVFCETVELRASGIRADWVDPADPSFVATRLRSPVSRRIHTNSRTRALACDCISIWDDNQIDGRFSNEVISVIEYAQCYYSCILPIEPNSVRLSINQANLPEGTLATASSVASFSTTNGRSIGYPCALVNLIGAPYNCDSSDFDMQLTVDVDSVSYYYGTDGNVPDGEYDFLTVVLHEFGHAFGFVSYATGDGYESDIVPFVYINDYFYRYDRGSNSEYPYRTNPPTASHADDASTSNSLFYQGTAYTDGKIYAPSNFQQGSSVSHLDEDTYPPSDVNSLMTPRVRNGESNHVLGPLLCDAFLTIGYPVDTALCSIDIGITEFSLTSTPTPTRSPTVNGQTNSETTQTSASTADVSTVNTASANSPSDDSSNGCPVAINLLVLVSIIVFFC